MSIKSNSKNLFTRKFVVLLSSTLTFILLFSIYYIHHQKIQAISSDVTTMLPLLSDWLNGNFLLKNWIVGTNSFFFSDTIWCIPEKLLGLSSSQVMSCAGALFHAGFVTLMLYVYIIKQNLQKFNIYDILKYITYLAIAGTIPYNTTYVYLNLNGHAGTIFVIAIELVFLHLWNNSSIKPSIWLIIYTIFGVLIDASDGIALLLLYAPLCIYAVYYLIWPKLGIANRKKYLYLLICNLMIPVGGKIFNKVIMKLGGCQVQGVSLQLLSLKEAISRIKPFAVRVYDLFGCPVEMWQTNPIYGYFVNILLVLIAIAIIWQIIKAIKSCPDSKSLFLSLAIITNVFGCLFVNAAIVDRYILSVPMFGLVLVIRTYYPLIDSIFTKKIISKALIYMITTTIAIVFCVYNTQVTFSKNDASADAKNMAIYIQTNDLGNGYGDFWSASLISSYTNFENLVIPVFTHSEGFQQYSNLVDVNWYSQTEIHYILLYADDTKNSMCKKSDITQFLGTPDKEKIIGQYELMYYVSDVSDKMAKDIAFNISSSNDFTQAIQCI